MSRLPTRNCLNKSCLLLDYSNCLLRTGLVGRLTLGAAAAAPPAPIPRMEMQHKPLETSSPEAGSALVICSWQGCSAPAALLLGLSHNLLLPSPSTLQAVPLFIPPPRKSACLKGVIKQLHLGKAKLRHRRTILKKTICRVTQQPHAITRHPIPFPTTSPCNDTPKGGLVLAGESPSPSPDPAPQLSLAGTQFCGSHCPAVCRSPPGSYFPRLKIMRSSPWRSATEPLACFY